MKELQIIFEGRGQVKGYSFHQIAKTDEGFIYSVQSDSSRHYEVFKRVENTLYNTVSYPSDKSFGIWAWTTPKLERAIEILESFVNTEKLAS